MMLQSDGMKKVLLTLLCAVGYIAFVLLMQAIVPGNSGFGAEKNQLGYSAGIFALTALLYDFSRGFFLRFSAFFLLWMSIALLETRVGMAVNGIEIILTASLATLLFAIVSVAAYVASILPSKILRTAGRILVGVLLFCTLLYPFLFWGYYGVSGQFLSVDTVLAIFQTNTEEAFSYLQMQHSLLPIFIACGLIVLGYISHKYAIGGGYYKNRIQYVLILFILVVSGLKFPAALDCQPGGVILTTKAELKAYDNYGANLKRREEELARSSISLSQKSPGIYMVILGESQTRDHMSLYGYERETNPWLSSVAQDPSYFIFSNAYSNHASTVPNITYALSEKNQYNDIPLSEAYSLVEMAKAAGYKTFWVSNQFRFGAHDTPISTIAATADRQIWINNRSGNVDNSSYYDEKLADVIPDLSNVSHAVIFVHLMGCHWTYSDRYPAEFAKYAGEDALIDTYDDAILYNDFVIRRLTDAMEKYPHFKGWIFISDHGEDVDHHIGHDATRFTWQMARIPLIMHFSDSFISENPEIFETLSAHRESYWTNDLLYNLMLSVLGIENTPHREEYLDLASPSYDRTKENLMTLHGKKRISEAP